MKTTCVWSNDRWTSEINAEPWSAMTSPAQNICLSRVPSPGVLTHCTDDMLIYFSRKLWSGSVVPTCILLPYSMLTLTEGDHLVKIN